MKKILFIFVFLLLTGFAYADDLQVATISLSPTSPNSNQVTNIHTEVILRNANTSLSTSVTIDYGNGISNTYPVTLTPNLLFAIDESITYVSAGNYLIDATIDPINLINDTDSSNNNLQRSVTVVNPPAPIISAQLASLSLTASQGTSQSGTIMLRNNGTSDLTSITISLSSMTSGTNTLSGVSINPTSISLLQVNDFTNLNFVVNVLSTAAVGTYTGNVLVDANGKQFTAPITVVVTAAPVVSLSITSLSLQGVQGTTQTGIITLTNTGTVALSNIALSLTSLTSSTSTLGNITVVPTLIPSLSGGSNINLNIVTNIPANQTPGAYSGTLTATVNGEQFTTSVIVDVYYAVLTKSFVVNDLTFSPTDGSDGRGKTLISNLNIVNNGNQPLNLSLASSISSIYDLRIGSPLINLNPGASANIPVTLTTLTTQDTGSTLLSGGIQISSINSVLSKTSNVYINIPDFSIGMLEIYGVVADIDGRTASLDRNESYNKLKPDMSVELTIRVRNNYNNIENIDIENIQLDVSSTGDIDIDDSEDVGDLDSLDKEEFTVRGSVPSDADNGDKYYITIRATGTDSYGTSYTDTYYITLKVKTASHDIWIDSYSFSPNKIVCNGTSTAKFVLENMGKYDEDKVHLELRSESLGLEKIFEDRPLDEDDKYTEYYSFKIENVTAKTYDIIATTYYDGKESNEEVLTLNTLPCDTEQYVEEYTEKTIFLSGDSNVVSNSPNYISSGVVPITGATIYSSNSISNNLEYKVIFLIGVITVSLILIIVLLIFF